MVSTRNQAVVPLRDQHVFDADGVGLSITSRAKFLFLKAVFDLNTFCLSQPPTPPT